MNECTFAGCARTRTSIKDPNGLCKGHYNQKNRGLELKPLRERNDLKSAADLCSVDSCGRLESCRGLCFKHLRRMYTHGDPHVTRPQGFPVIWGPAHANWKDIPSYNSAHTRIRRRKGPAKRYSCVECPRRAAHWAYDHACPNEIRLGGSPPYSTDLDRYLPMCAFCHKKLDNRKARANA